MSTSPRAKSSRPEDRVISLLSHWLARHLDTSALVAKLGEIDLSGLSPGEIEVVEELAAELDAARPRAQLEPIVRETVEALALGV
jgi:hypothetical protein